MVPKHIISEINTERICKTFHVLPSLVVSIILGIKILPAFWPYYAVELDKNGFIVTVAVFLIFIPVAIINGIVIDKVLSSVNTKYLAYKNDLNELDT